MCARAVGNVAKIKASFFTNFNHCLDARGARVAEKFNPDKCSATPGGPVNFMEPLPDLSFGKRTSSFSLSRNGQTGSDGDFIEAHLYADKVSFKINVALMGFRGRNFVARDKTFYIDGTVPD